MIPVTYPSSVSTSKESQMVVYSLSSVAGLQRWTDYIPVKYQSTGSDVPNSFNTNGYIACDFITNLTGKQAWVDYIPVFVDNLATTAWQVSDTGFIPFNTLAGGGTYVSLDLNFLNTTALDSRITFSRGSNATLTGSNGLIQYAPHNLLTNSEDFEAAAWMKLTGGAGVTPVVTANFATAPDGSLTADRVQLDAGANGASDYSLLRQTFTGTSPLSRTLWVKSNTGANQTICLVATNPATKITVTPTWQRLGDGQTSAGTSQFDISVGGAGLTGATADILVWGAQANLGSTAQSYNSTTPKNLLGFTQEPENAAWTKSNSYVQQNLLTWSQDFDNAAWTLNNPGTRTANTDVAPDGTTTADTVTDNITTNFTSVRQTVTVANNNQQYTCSVYFKKTTSASSFPGFSLSLIGGTLKYASGALNTTTGVATARTGEVPDFITVTDAGTYWRVQWGITNNTSGNTSLIVDLLPAVNTDASATWAATTIGSTVIWGAQLVQGSTAGDYTQTTSAAAPTRYLNWDGTLTGRKLVETTAAAASHSLLQSATVVSGVTYTWTTYLKAAERTFAAVYISGPNQGIYVNLLTGAFAGNLIAAPVSYSIQNAGNGWWRVAVSAVATSGVVNPYVWMSDASPNYVYTGDGTSGIYVSDFQLSNSASVDPYVYNPQAAAASAAYYGPRFDYDPITLAAKGLLIEEQRTNLALYSNDFANAWWNKIGGSITSTTEIAPDGSTTACVFSASATNAELWKSVTLAASTIYTSSIYIKRKTGTGTISIRNSANTNWIPVTINSSTWTRVTNDSGASGGNAYCDILVSTLGDEIYVWGAQLEAGSFATSYIPTAASQVTRNADSASMLGDNFYTWYNPNQGTLGAEGGGQNYVSSARIASISDGTFNNRICTLLNSQTTIGGLITTGGSSQANITGSVTSSASSNKIALGYAVDNVNIAVNGASGTLDTSASIPAVNLLRIGAGETGTTSFLNGTIRRIGYYNTRLPDSTLQAMTT